MAEIILVAREKPAYSANTEYHDKALEAGGITVDQDTFTAGLDRLYNTQGLDSLYMEIENTGGANGLTWRIEKARKQYTDITTLVNADFSVIKGNTDVAFGAIEVQSVIRVDPEITAIRARVKRQTAGQDTTMKGIVSAR